MNDRKESVLILCPFFRPNIGGVETHLDELVEYLRKNNHEVFVITYKPLTTKASALGIERKQNLEIHRLSWFGHGLFHKLESLPLFEFLYLFPYLFTYTLFFLLKNKGRIDVIHAHGLVSALATMVLSKLYRKRCVVSIHTLYNLVHHPLLSFITKRILASFDKILCLSNQSRNELLKAGIPKDNMEIYLSWVDQQLFRPISREECRQSLKLSGEFVALFVGRLIPAKGIRVLLKAAAMERESTFIIFGDTGPLAEEVRTAALQLSNVIFVENGSHQDLPVYYNAADVIIAPSLYEEPLGRVIIEAISCGTPVIASNKGGIPEVVDSSVGILIEPEADEIIKSMMYLYEHPDELESLRNNCRSYAERRFSENNAKIIEESYNLPRAR